MDLLSLLLAAGVIGSALIGGVYFAFSSFIMQSLGLQGEGGAEAMRRIDEIILKSAFMPVFYATTLLSMALTGFGAFALGSVAGWAMLAGGLVYFVGMFVVTAAFNVPLNNQLAASPGSSAMWTRYLSVWTGWNTVRTVASLVASALYLLALLL